VQPAGGHRTIEAGALSAEDARHLDGPPGLPALRIESVSRTADGTVFEYFSAIYRGESFKIRVGDRIPMTSVLPFSAKLDFRSGDLVPYQGSLVRRLSEMPGAFADAEAAQRLIRDGGDPIIYRAFDAPVPEARDHLVYRTTIISPGRVGAEYFMTKGHHHMRDSAEFYLGMAGRGLMVLQDKSGELRIENLAPELSVYVPPGWAHRTVNTGDEDLIFLAVYLGDAGHDYASVERDGFAARVVATSGGPEVVEAA
jgi:glucose-6-phosphate isomerase, archaeal